MKYFTKEWFHILQYTDLHLPLKPSDRAVEYSEDYFQELYAQHVQDRLDMLKRASEVDREALAMRFESSDAPLVRLDGKAVTPEQQKQVDAMRHTIAENLRKAPPFTFDPEAVKRSIHDQYLHELQHLEQSLPVTIQKKVADMRVLALGHTTREVVDDITAFCKANEAAVRAAADAYREEFSRNFKDGKPPFYQDFDLHDCRLTSMRQDGKDVCIDFNDCTCRFRDAEIIHCDAPVEGTYWLYDEIYPADGSYEIHALLQQLQENTFSNECLVEWIVRCRDVEIIWAVE